MHPSFQLNIEYTFAHTRCVASLVYSFMVLLFCCQPPGGLISDPLDYLQKDIRLFPHTIKPFLRELKNNHLTFLATITANTNETPRQQIHRQLGDHMRINLLQCPPFVVSSTPVPEEMDDVWWQVLRGGNRLDSGQKLQRAPIMSYEMRDTIKLRKMTTPISNPWELHTPLLLIGLLFNFRDSSTRTNGNINSWRRSHQWATPPFIFGCSSLFCISCVAQIPFRPS